MQVMMHVLIPYRACRVTRRPAYLSCRPVGVQDVVAAIKLDGLAEELDRFREAASAERGIALGLPGWMVGALRPGPFEIAHTVQSRRLKGGTPSERQPWMPTAEG